MNKTITRPRRYLTRKMTHYGGGLKKKVKQIIGRRPRTLNNATNKKYKELENDALKRFEKNQKNKEKQKQAKQNENRMTK